MIYETNDGCFVISSGGTWLTGSYLTKRAAKYAFKFPDEELYRLQESINDRESEEGNRNITFEDLQALRRKLRNRKH